MSRGPFGDAIEQVLVAVEESGAAVYEINILTTVGRQREVPLITVIMYPADRDHARNVFTHLGITPPEDITSGGVQTMVESLGVELRVAVADPTRP